jgi:hypothetical protein
MNYPPNISRNCPVVIIPEWDNGRESEQEANVPCKMDADFRRTKGGSLLALSHNYCWLGSVCSQPSLTVWLLLRRQVFHCGFRTRVDVHLLVNILKIGIDGLDGQ